MVPGQTASGTPYSQQSIIAVHWPWLTLLIVLLVLASVLLLKTVWDSVNGQVGFWDSNPLTLLFHAKLSSEAAATIAGDQATLYTSDRIKASAAGFQVRMVKGASGAFEIYENVESDTHDVDK